MPNYKAPRTIEEAFGSMACHYLEPEPPDWQDTVVVRGCVLTLIACALMVLLGVIT